MSSKKVRSGLLAKKYHKRDGHLRGSTRKAARAWPRSCSGNSFGNRRAAPRLWSSCRSSDPNPDPAAIPASFRCPPPPLSRTSTTCSTRFVVGCLLPTRRPHYLLARAPRHREERRRAASSSGAERKQHCFVGSCLGCACRGSRAHRCRQPHCVGVEKGGSTAETCEPLCARLLASKPPSPCVAAVAGDRSELSASTQPRMTDRRERSVDEALENQDSSREICVWRSRQAMGYWCRGCCSLPCASPSRSSRQGFLLQSTVC
eukprot:3210545-Rhodomonas_salina.3